MTQSTQHYIDDLKIARQLQISLLPQDIHTETLTISGFYRPVEMLGGDLYHWETRTDGKTAVVLIDVMGHGTATSMICMYIKSQLSGLIQKHDTAKGFVQALNEVMLEFNRQIEPNLYFCTAFYMLIDEPAQTIEYINAGHPPVVLLEGVSDPKWLEIGCPPIGIYKRIPIETGQLSLTEDTQLLLYSDGIYDLFREFNIDMTYFLHFSKFYSPLKIDEIKLIDKIGSFVDQMPHKDDISLVYVELNGGNNDDESH